MRIATWNINSVRLRSDQVLKFIKNQKIDIICLQETKTQDEYFPEKLFKKIEVVAKKYKKFNFYKFKLKKIDNFYAFVQSKKNNNINKLSNRLVRELFKFRSPLTKKEIDRRNPSKLSK